jgi:hypothetical protein
MNPLAEQLLVWIINRILTPDVIKGAEVQFVEFLKAASEKTPSKIDDALVKLVALALGVEMP